MSPTARAGDRLGGGHPGACRGPGRGVRGPGDVLLLSGDLGAGKTTFAQGFGRALGVDEPVTSPTFTLVRQYETTAGATGVRNLLHADVYRLDNLGEIVDLGLGQLVEDGGVALVEWGDAAEPVLGRGACPCSWRRPRRRGAAGVTVTGAGPRGTTGGTSWWPPLAPWTAAMRCSPLETATDLVGAAVVADDGGVAERSHLGGRAHAELLAPAIEEVCALVGCRARATSTPWPSTSVPGCSPGCGSGWPRPRRWARRSALGVLGGRASTSWPPAPTRRLRAPGPPGW